jgi:hypothetical protein
MPLISNNPGKPCSEAIAIRGRGREGVETPYCLRFFEQLIFGSGWIETEKNPSHEENFQGRGWIEFSGETENQKRCSISKNFLI